MLEKLGEIDTAAIEELVEIKAEQELLESRLASMNERKGRVTEEVFERVRADYGARLADLEDKARPLKDRARREYARLRDLHQQCEDGLRAAQLDTEELQFRHELGEFEDEEFQQQLEASKASEAERGKELAEAERLTERFVEAFRSQEELEEPVAEPAADRQPPSGSQDAVVAGPAPAAVAQVRDPEPPSFEAPADHTAAIPARVALDEAPESTGEPPTGAPPRVTETQWTAPPPPPVPQPVPPPPVPDAGYEGKTVVSGGARLDVRAEDGPVQEYTLGVAPTSVGRSPDCVICLPSESVSRRHAEVFLDGRGYVVRDLGSNNGTFVNEQQVTEVKLNDGDVVRVGLTSLVFREG